MHYLYMPDDYYKIAECTCGPNSWRFNLVGNKIFGLSIIDACCIHDYMYTYPVESNVEYKFHADRVFLNNMLRIIDAKTKNSWLKKLRRWKARRYYNAVDMFGGPSFWSGKNSVDNLFPQAV